MSWRTILKNASREALFRTPTEPYELDRRYILALTDHDLVRIRCRPENRLGLTVRVLSAEVSRKGLDGKFPLCQPSR